MSTENVIVGFTPAANPGQQDTWTFDRPKVRVKEASQINLHQEAGNPNWKFVNIDFPKGDGGNFTWTVAGDGRLLRIEDSFVTEGEFCYRVIVSDANGNPHTSPDPQIVNSPGGMVDKHPMSGIPTVAIVVGVIVGAIVGALIDMHTGSLESRGPLKGAIVGAIIGAIVGYALGRRRRRP